MQQRQEEKAKAKETARLNAEKLSQAIATQLAQVAKDQKRRAEAKNNEAKDLPKIITHPVMMYAYDVPGSGIQSWVKSMKEAVYEIDDEKGGIKNKIENFENAMREIQDGWTRGVPVNLEVFEVEAKKFQRELDTEFKRAGRSSEQLLNVEELFSDFPNVVSSEINRLQKKADQRVVLNWSSIVNDRDLKRQEGFGMDWKDILPIPSDDANEKKLREDEEEDLGSEIARENALERLRQRNSEEWTYNYPGGQFNVRREKDKNDELSFRVTLHNSDAMSTRMGFPRKNLQEAMASMVQLCHQSDPTRPVELVCEDIRSPESAKKMAEELKYAIMAAEQERVKGVFIGIQLNASAKAVLAAVGDKENLEARAASLYKDWQDDQKKLFSEEKSSVTQKSNLGKLFSANPTTVLQNPNANLGNQPEEKLLNKAFKSKEDKPEERAQEVKAAVQELQTEFSRAKQLEQSIGDQLDAVKGVLEKEQGEAEDDKDSEKLTEQLAIVERLQTAQKMAELESKKLEAMCDHYQGWMELPVIKKIFVLEELERQRLQEEVKGMRSELMKSNVGNVNLGLENAARDLKLEIKNIEDAKAKAIAEEKAKAAASSVPPTPPAGPLPASVVPSVSPTPSAAASAAAAAVPPLSSSVASPAASVSSPSAASSSSPLPVSPIPAADGENKNAALVSPVSPAPAVVAAAENKNAPPVVPASSPSPSVSSSPAVATPSASSSSSSSSSASSSVSISASPPPSNDPTVGGGSPSLRR